MPPPKQDANISAAIQQQPIHKPRQMVSQPGIMRDGTQLQKQTYLDGRWMRFWQDKPRKMLGYRQLVSDVAGIGRSLTLFTSDGFCYTHVGTTEAFQRFSIDLQTGVNTATIDRTPGGYVPNDNVLWQADTIYDQNEATTLIFATPQPSLQDITSSTAAPVYWGDVLKPDVLVPAVDVSSHLDITTSGGLVAVSGGYLLLYGHDGVIRWNVAGNPFNYTDAGAGDSRPVADKIVKGLPIRGNSAPAAIFWSLSSLILGNFVLDSPFWRFSTVTTSGSILSSNGVVEHNGVYYWPHTSGFSTFAGVMQDIPNDYNQQYFLNNLNFSQRQKVFAMKVPRFKEIWWCFPFGQSTECNHAIIYRYDKGYWYDTPLPNGGRAAGYYDVTYSFPMMTGVDLDADGNTSVWQHETGVDEISGTPPQALAIKSYFRTHEFNMPVAPAGQTGESSSLSFGYIEPDFAQVGDLTVEIFSRNNARSAEQSPDDENYPYVIADPPPTEQDEVLDIKWTGRLTSFLVQSNTRGGNYNVGSPLLHLMPSDGRITG